MERRVIEKLTEEFMGQFREVFRKRREEQSLRRCDVAERSGLSPQMITYFEEAERQPLLINYVRLCLSLNVVPSELMMLVEEHIGLRGGSVAPPAPPAPLRAPDALKPSLPV